MNDDNSQVTGRTIARSAIKTVSPKLSRIRQDIFDVLLEHGPQTANEIVGKLPPTGLSNNNVRSRLTELVKLGRAAIAGAVKDPISGYSARQYRAVEPGEIPARVQLLRRASRAQLENEIARLRAENEALKARLPSMGRCKDDPR
jgi:predicted ArsR family transcriptional regulator